MEKFGRESYFICGSLKGHVCSRACADAAVWLHSNGHCSLGDGTVMLGQLEQPKKLPRFVGDI